MTIQPRRSQNVIDFEVQVSLLRKIAAHWVFFIVANAIALMIWTRLISDPLGTWQSSWSNFINQFAPMLVVSLVLLPVFLLDAARLSNRFTGPILRLRRTLAEIVAGRNPSPIVFRQSDFWKSLATDFNAAFALKENAGETPAASTIETEQPNLVARRSVHPFS